MKKFIALLLALVMVLGLAACSVEQAPAPTEAPKAEAPAAPEAEAPAEPAAPEAPAVATELTLMTYPIGNWGDQATVDALMAKFEADTGIMVTVEYLTYADGDATIDAAITAGKAPDLVMEGPERLVANWGAKGKMVNIADLFDETDKAEIFAGPLAACFADENTAYEYPVVMTAHCMAINKTLFEAAGAMQYIDVETRTWTTENFWKAVDAVYAHTGKTVGAVFCKDQGGDQGNRVLITNLYEGAFTAPDHSAYTWNVDGNIKALTELLAHPAIEYRPDLAGGDELKEFYQGNLAMATCWNIAQQLNPAGANGEPGKAQNGDEIMVLAFPSVDGTSTKLNGGIWGFGIFDNGDAARIEAAKTFIKYFGDSAATIDAVKAANYFAVRDTAEGVDLSGIWADNATMKEYTVLMPMLGDYYQVTKGWTEARYEWWNMLQEVGFSGGEGIADIVAAREATANAVFG